MNDLNMELRTDILEASLGLEKTITMLLTFYLGIFHDNRKALTNKSGNLSAQNRIDLMYDLEILEKEEYEKFSLILTFRNQFVHNADCSSFTEAVEILGNEKRNKLLKLTGSDLLTIDEGKLREAFERLIGDVNRIALEKIDKKGRHVNAVLERLKAPNRMIIELVDRHSDFISAILRFCESKGAVVEQGNELRPLELLQELTELVTAEFEYLRQRPIPAMNFDDDAYIHEIFSLVIGRTAKMPSSLLADTTGEAASVPDAKDPA